MNDKLAKKLKEKGFPQIWPKPDFVELHDAIRIQEIMSKYEKNVYIPTLEELIEACGKYFCRFELRYNPNKHLTNQVWWAYARDVKDNFFDIGGETPSEAVANLWLALHK